jgi:hypothetical protein
MEKDKPSSTENSENKSSEGHGAPATEAHPKTDDPRLIPGGARGTDVELGMSAMDRSDVPSGAQKPDQLDVRDTPEGVE